MGKNQGKYRLLLGFERSLTASEINRGYIFVTKDQEFKKMIGGQLTVDILGIIEKNKKLDNYGRLFFDRNNIGQIGSTPLHFKYRAKDNLLQIKEAK